MVFKDNKPRGATELRERQGISHHHVIAVALLSAVVAVTAIITPSGDVNARRSQQDLEAAGPGASASPAVEEEKLASVAEASATVDALSEPPEVFTVPQWEEFVVRSGDNLSLIFKRAGFGDVDVYQVVHTAPQGRSLERIFPGQTMAFQRDELGELAAVRHDVDELQTVTYRRMDGGFSSERNAREPEVRTSWASIEIESSLFLAGKEAGLSSNLILEVANVFGGVLDFVLDPRTGDTLDVLYEELYLDDQKFRDGKILAASFTNKGERFEAFRYVDENGFPSYYNSEGVSMRKAFLMAPVDFTRISSNFNPRRLHPIHKTVRPHNGTDYAAPRGTPVFASGDGRVVKAGYSRANGNYVFIQHGDRYVTKYLHLHKRKVNVGQRVVQSQVIGTVGSTGAATGPHLHYEFLVNGKHKNPRTIHKSLPKAKSLPESEMPRFEVAIAKSAAQLASIEQEKAARELAATAVAAGDAP